MTKPLLALLALTACHDTTVVMPQSLPQPGQMTVTGSATIQVAPDCADLTMTVSANASKQGAAVDAARKRSSDLVAAIKKLGLEDGDLKLSTMSIEPIYEWIGNRNVFKGYTARIVLTYPPPGVRSSAYVRLRSRSRAIFSLIRFIVPPSADRVDELVRPLVRDRERPRVVGAAIVATAIVATTATAAATAAATIAGASTKPPSASTHSASTSPSASVVHSDGSSAGVIGGFICAHMRTVSRSASRASGAIHAASSKSAPVSTPE